jgi:tetratricopeptide (TPR) repeat protein
MKRTVPPPAADPLRRKLAQALESQRQGRHAEAERAYQQLLAADPDQPEALHYLGLLSHQVGRAQQAETLLRRSLELSKDNPVFLYNFAGVLAGQGRWQDAVPLYQRALELGPGNADAWHGLAAALLALGHAGDAVSCWQRGLAADPTHRASWSGMAEALREQGLRMEALEACRRAHALDPDDAQVTQGLAETLAETGAHAQALELVEAALKKGRDPLLLLQKGLILSALGRFDAAADAWRTALVQDPDFFQAALSLAGIGRLDPQSPIAAHLRARLDAPAGLPLSEQVSGHFALGKLLEDAKRYPEAFREYLEGNRLYRPLVRYSTDSQRRYSGQLRRGFGPGLQERRGAGNPSELPVFIVGMPRSGTSLVEQILAGHPAVHAGGELTLLSDLWRRRLGPLFSTDFAASVAALPDAELRAVADAYVAGLRALAPAARRVTDKMPSNFMQLGLIHALFPRAHIIHCRRDPVDTCVSCFTNLFRNGQPFSYDLRELGEYYRLYAELMEFWRQTLPAGAMLELDYERLVEDLEGGARSLVAHCGLDWDPACLDYTSTERAVQTASAWQVRQPLYRSSVQRWRRYGDQLGPLLEALGAGPVG